MVYDFLRFFHILAVVFMSAPLYNLIVVHERRHLNKPPFIVDKYFENIIRGAALRCYVYQSTALVTGILLVPLGKGTQGRCCILCIVNLCASCPSSQLP